MAQPNTPNGVPPQLRRPMMEKQPPPMQFNGVHSSQSSRDSSPLTTPRVGQIPASQLPPARPTVSASSQLPSASSASVSNVTHQNLLTQKMAQLNISNGDDRFGTSTPVLTANLQQRPSGGSAFSPIVSTSNSSSQKVEDLRPQQQQPQSNFVPVALPSQASQNVAHNVTTGASQIQNPGIPQQNNQMSRPVNQQAYQQVGPVSNVYQNHQQTQQQVQQTLNSNRFNNEPQPYLNQLPLAPPNVPITTSSNPIMQSSYQSEQQLPQTRPQISQTQHLFQSNSGIQPSPSSLQTPQQNQQQLRPQINNAQPQNTFQRSNTTQLPPAPVLPHQQQNIPQIPPAIGQQQFTQNRPPGPPGSVPQPSQFKNNLHQNRYPQMPPPVLAPAAAAPALNSLQQQNYYQQQQQQQQQQLPQQLNNAMQQPNFGQFNSAQPQLQPQLSNLYSNSQQQPQTDSITRQGFNRLWGQESVDLLQNPNILPADKVQAPRVYLGHEEMDAANCSPDVFRCTMTKIPESSSLLQKSRLPLGVLIHPFKDLQYLPVIQCNVIVRCRACRTYINPFVYFVDTKRWKCNLCYRINELPDEFQYDPVSKTYGDPSRRPEIKSSTIEYIAPTEYMLRPPQPAIYLFLFDVSRLAVESGYLQSVCGVLLDELQNLPGDARTQVGIIAYDSYLHFFSLGEGLSQPHEMTVLEIDDVFLPCPENLLVNLKDRMELLVDLLTQLPNRYLNSYDNNSALGAALQAAHKMMGPTGGRVTVFQASLPNVGPGALTSREDPAQRASSEINHLNPANDFYKRLALECSGQQIAVDLFVLNSQYVDIATISGICRFSGGCVHHFPLFKASKVLQSERFERCFRRYLTRKIGFEAVMRIRCTRGLSIHTFHGNFFVRSTDLLSLPNVNPDAGFGMQVSIDENLSDVQTICFQAALLYTSSKGERRIRVHTLCLPVCATLSDVINSADQQCIAGLLAKMAVDRSQQSSLSDAREAFINVAIDILSSYKMCLNMGSGVGGLLVPKCLQLLPLYISAMLKHIAFRIGTSTRLDDRVKAMIDMKTKPLVQLIQMVYPDLYPVHNLEEQQVIMNSEEEPVPHPPHLQLTARCLESKGAFLMDTGEHMILLVCPGVSLQFLNEALGLPDYLSLTDDMYELPVLDNPRNQRLHQFLSHLNDEKPFAATLHVIRDNSPHRVEFYERLIEDRVENALSYHEFLQHLKTQVK